MGLREQRLAAWRINHCMELPALMDLPLVGSGVDGTLIRRSVIDLLFRFCFLAHASPMSLEFAF
jgi:hypothetical protein